jgi:hypothetical protein
MPTLKKYFFTYSELAVWTVGLVWLALMDPSVETHFSLCMFKWIGLSFCPGCGLGHAISWLFHGDLQQSVRSHPLGLFAVTILVYRIFTLIKYHFNSTTLKQ